VGSVLGAAILAWAGNFFTNGGVIRALGGLSVSQITDAELFSVGAHCGEYRNAAMGDAKATFCFLSDVSVRQDNAGGWNVCKIEVGDGSSPGKLFLVAQMTNGVCGKTAEISCSAKCIKY
jgi:hypothetical protein